MKTAARKSTALISLVLVLLNLLGLGFAGCDTRDDDQTPNFASATDGGGDASADGGDAAGFDFQDPDDPFNLDPVNVPAGGSTGPVAYPTTQPLASSSFAALPPNRANHYYHSGPGLIFLPIPFRTGYQPPHRAPFRTSPSSSSSVFRSTPGRSSGVSRSSSSGTSLGGFGSSGASHSASS